MHPTSHRRHVPTTPPHRNHIRGIAQHARTPWWTVTSHAVVGDTSPAIKWAQSMTAPRNVHSLTTAVVCHCGSKGRNGAVVANLNWHGCPANTSQRGMAVGNVDVLNGQDRRRLTFCRQACPRGLHDVLAAVADGILGSPAVLPSGRDHHERVAAEIWGCMLAADPEFLTASNTT